MVAAGEDPRFIARRLIIAHRRTSATPTRARSRSPSRQPRRSTGSACPRPSTPSPRRPIYIATAPKSDSVGRAYCAAMADVDAARVAARAEPPAQRAGDRRMKQHGIGVGYRYPHDFEGDDVEQQYLPDELVGRRYYVPIDQGYEATIAARMEARGEARAERPRRKKTAGPADGLDERRR